MPILLFWGLGEGTAKAAGTRQILTYIALWRYKIYFGMVEPRVAEYSQTLLV